MVHLAIWRQKVHRKTRCRQPQKSKCVKSAIIRSRKCDTNVRANNSNASPLIIPQIPCETSSSSEYWLSGCCTDLESADCILRDDAPANSAWATRLLQNQNVNRIHQNTKQMEPDRAIQNPWYPVADRLTSDILCHHNKHKKCHISEQTPIREST